VGEVADSIVDLLLSEDISGKVIFVYPHVRLDGDCIGSAAALVAVLRNINRRSYVMLEEPIPERLAFMNIPDDLYRIYSSDNHNQLSQEQGLAVAVDCSDAGRMGSAGTLYEVSSSKAVLDHHVSSGEATGTRLVVPQAAATAELVLHIIRIIETRTHKSLLNEQIANFLMVGIQSDTGRFSYQNTTPDTLRAAADLLEAGANLYLNAYHLFDLTSVERMRLISKALSGARMFYDGKMAMTAVTQEMIRDANASDYAADGLVSNLRDIEGVVASFVVRESGDGEIRVNIRSREPFDSAAFAEIFGGGGHHRAAGFSVRDSSVNEVCKSIIHQAESFFTE